MMDDGERMKRLTPLQKRRYPGFIAKEYVTHLWVSQPRQIGARDNHFRTVIATHGVESDGESRV
jgi:hypothetical protein